MLLVSNAGNVAKHVRAGIALCATLLQQDIRVACTSVQGVDECKRLEYSFAMTISRESINYVQMNVPHL